MNKIFKLLFLCWLSPFALSAQWTPDAIITPLAVSASTNEYMASCLAVSGDSLYVVYADHRHTGAAGIWFLHSYDNGQSWSVPVPITDTLRNSNWPAVASWGPMVHVVWHDSVPGSKASFYCRSTDAGQTWGPVTVLDSTTKFWPGLACWDSLVVVSLNEDLSGNTEVFFRRSTDNGVTWDAKQQISNAPNRSEDPAINVLGDDVHLSWNDKRSGTMNIYYRHSPDAGLTWGPEVQLTTADSYTEMVCLDRNHVDVPLGINTGSFHVWLAQSADTGTTFAAPFQVTSTTSAGAIMIRDSMQMHMMLGMLGTTSYLHSADGGANWDTAVALGSGGIGFIGRNKCTLHVIWANSGKVHYRKNPTGDCVTVNVPESQFNSSSVNISPNPAHHKVKLTIAPNISVASVSLCDMSGKIIEQRTGDWNEWNIEKMKGGSYLFVISEKDGTSIVQKLSVTE
jgi:hypothetical protein